MQASNEKRVAMTTQRLVYYNSEFVPERNANISIFDSALMFGDPDASKEAYPASVGAALGLMSAAMTRPAMSQVTMLSAIFTPMKFAGCSHQMWLGTFPQMPAKSPTRATKPTRPR